jgi:hypothetical protein
MVLWVSAFLFATRAALGVPSGVEPACWITPVEGDLKVCELSGDFDGDKKKDRAVLVVETGERRRKGIAVMFASGRRLVLGAGHALGNGSDDFSWMNLWRVVPRVEARKTWRAPSWLKGDALLVEEAESAGGLLLWKQRRFVWQQAAD